jgi:hypothetical protein
MGLQHQEPRMGLEHKQQASTMHQHEGKPLSGAAHMAVAVCEPGQISRGAMVTEAAWTVTCIRKDKACRPFINWPQALPASLQEIIVAAN